MQIVKRVALALTFIFALMAMPAVADDAIDALNEALDREDIFTEYAIPIGVNKGFMITECGSILVLGVAVFDGPPDVIGKVLIASRPSGATQSQGDVIMNQLLTEIVLEYKADGEVIELSDITDRFCA